MSRAQWRLASGLLLGISACGGAEHDAERGASLYAAGRFPEAYEAFRAAAARRGATPELERDLGAVLYRLRRYEQSAAHYERATRVGPAAEREASYFDLGNAYVRASEDAADKGPLLRAVAAYQQALLLTPGDSDARWNLELAIRKLNAAQESGGGPGPGHRGNWGRGDMTKAGYAGQPEAATGATAGGGYGAGQGESVKELSPSEARQLVEGVRREQLTTHAGRNVGHRNTRAGHHDW